MPASPKRVPMGSLPDYSVVAPGCSGGVDPGRGYPVWLAVDHPAGPASTVEFAVVVAADEGEVAEVGRFKRLSVMTARDGSMPGSVGPPAHYPGG